MNPVALPGGPVSQAEQVLWFLLLLLTTWAAVYLLWKYRGRRRK